MPPAQGAHCELGFGQGVSVNIHAAASEIKGVRVIKIGYNASNLIRGALAMPTISMFYGIIISLYFYDNERHSLPHIHAKYQ